MKLRIVVHTFLPVFFLFVLLPSFAYAARIGDPEELIQNEVDNEVPALSEAQYHASRSVFLLEHASRALLDNEVSLNSFRRRLVDMRATDAVENIELRFIPDGSYERSGRLYFQAIKHLPGCSSGRAIGGGLYFYLKPIDGRYVSTKGLSADDFRLAEEVEYDANITLADAAKILLRAETAALKGGKVGHVIVMSTSNSISTMESLISAFFQYASTLQKP